MMKFNVTIDGKEFEVEVGNITINRKKIEVEVERATAESKDRAGSTSKHVMEASVNPAKKYWNAPSSKATNAEETIQSPMPGTITSIEVIEGENVEKDQVLCILEAMKMENEIIAPRDAVVSKIVVSRGTPVKMGDMLILLK